MQPIISVGIMHHDKIEITFNGNYRCIDTNQIFTGTYTAEIADNQILFGSLNARTITLEPVDNVSTFDIHHVVIGINFHWQREEVQRFTGSLKLLFDINYIHAINIVPIEQYLTSVISSEMSATSSEELLKAHAVTSRSWLMAQLSKSKQVKATDYTSVIDTETEHIRWYDREDHTLFDVCADDHCQRYQGITRAASPYVTKAVNDTLGQVITHDGEICDARFSKCCGGITEQFENCWEPIHHKYLMSVADGNRQLSLLDLTQEDNARKWIMSEPEAFCNTKDKATLKQILNSYDQETSDFYRWKVRYSVAELSQLICQRTGIDYGDIKSLTAVERGPSGRIIKLRIEGSKRTLTIGKELEIRKALSATHLYSSAFVVDRDAVNGDFILHGAGWGHGVGLCQIGAAVMGEKGFGYKEILSHYFKNTIIEKRW